jgi:hypothetical protein
MAICVGLVVPMCEWDFSWCRSRFLQIFMRGTRYMFLPLLPVDFEKYHVHSFLFSHH